ncbi:unnamed protein product [Angiostrongylus costaricensis]|uniref:AcidPPc domain-containing protein n=1 Tax=Angiostrongylus costaricensis TaxID=334426 RepID=A0A0R3PLQ0_ANGCS|nr:unnamed protein product [Angiostrongylus costaricensis]
MYFGHKRQYLMILKLLIQVFFVIIWFIGNENLNFYFFFQFLKFLAAIGGEVIPQLIGTFHRGFFCDDASIRCPYKADTITNTNLFLYAIFVIILTVSFQKSFGSIIIGYAQIGAACLYVVINLTKSTVGRLRPHFLDVCKPKDLICQKCYRYITNYVCTGDADLVLEARKSFFSGHSAISMYSSTFAAVSLLAVSFLCVELIHYRRLRLISFSIGLMISYSRINDNKHHWSDVVVGVIVGVFFASYTVRNKLLIASAESHYNRLSSALLWRGCSTNLKRNCYHLEDRRQTTSLAIRLHLQINVEQSIPTPKKFEGKRITLPYSKSYGLHV